MKTTVYIVNTDAARLRLVLEPWGREYDVDPGAGQWFQFDGPDAALIEVRTRPGETTVYGWVGSSVNDGIDPPGPRVPDTPWSKNRRAKAFAALVLGVFSLPGRWTRSRRR